jgi:hypothetical protein
MFETYPLLRLRSAGRAQRLARQNAAKIQTETLMRLVQAARKTAFGRAHRFADIHTIAAYQAAVPLRRHEDLAHRLWQPNFPYAQNATWPGLIPYLARIPGPGAAKYLPVTQEMIWANHAAVRDVLAFHVNANPASRLGGGRFLLLGGCTSLRRMGPGVRSGDAAGIAGATMPRWLRARAWPPPAISGLADAEERLDRIAAGALGLDIRAMAGAPDRLLLFFERLSASHNDHPRSLSALFPRLELIVHAGALGPHQASFDGWLDGTAASCREIHATAEGLVAAADRGPGEGLRLLLDHGMFLEFIPPEDVGKPRPRRFWTGNAEPGQAYVLTLTSSAGLWSMITGTHIRLLSLDPPRIRIMPP